MKRLSFLLSLQITLLFSQFSFAQDCEDCRYITPLFDSVMVETIHFGEGLDSEGNLQQLYADVYQPYGDTVTNRPVLIFAFGGGFIQGSRTDWYVQEACELFARSGYVAVANDYRLGINPIEILFLQHMRIFFRPMQDMRATIQYLKADYSELGNNFNIDTSRILIGGASSGAITALMTAYCDKPSEMGEMGDISSLDDLGGFYSSTGFYPQYSWDGLATVNVAGAMINAEWIEPGDVPIISAHGDADDIVPYAYGPFGGGLLGGAFDLQGSAIVHQEAQDEGVCSYLYT
ncbi:MAG: alpha/beta hydrolase, partial [Flavobacteriales bacterium]|nr:alpha/beta hydrolase [Flavobacteriales bacterium]